MDSGAGAGTDRGSATEIPCLCIWNANHKTKQKYELLSVKENCIRNQNQIKIVIIKLHSRQSMPYSAGAAERDGAAGHERDGDAARLSGLVGGRLGCVNAIREPRELYVEQNKLIELLNVTGKCGD